MDSSHKDPQDEVVMDVARAVVVQVAPHELPLFRATSEAYLEDPERVLDEKSRDEMLGFGPAAAVVFLTPAVLEVAKTVVGFLWAQTRDALKDASSDAIDKRVKELFQHFGAGAAPKGGGAQKGDGAQAAGGAEAGLTKDELIRVRDVALQKGRELKLADDQAALLADAVVGGLATS
jgi:hypothetical protein